MKEPAFFSYQFSVFLHYRASILVKKNINCNHNVKNEMRSNILIDLLYLTYNLPKI